MKKILFSIALLVVTTVAFSQCATFEPGTQFSAVTTTTNGVTTTNYNFTINYSITGNASKSINVVITCGLGNLVNECYQFKGSGTKVYSGLVCNGGFAALKAILTPYTGSSCNGSACPVVIVLGASGGPLPVKLNEFSAIRSKQVVALNWNTEFEIDAKEFIVERAEGTDFRSIGSINSNGNSNVRKSYSFNDKNENTGTTYYRLKSVDLNNSFTYSEIRTVKGIGAVNDVTVYPNPARSNSKISVVGVTANSSIQLLDFSGKILKNMNSSTVNSLDLSGVKNGTYLIRIIDKSTNVTVNKSLTVSN